MINTDKYLNIVELCIGDFMILKIHELLMRYYPMVGIFQSPIQFMVSCIYSYV